MSEKRILANRYEMLELVGQGGMGAVYRGVDTQTGDIVAIKSLKSDIVAEDPSMLERFTREGEALRMLNHPSIVKMLATIEDKGQHYIIMEFVGSGSLEDLLQSQPKLPIERVLEISLDLADALTRAHRLKVIHRDLKPGNVLIAEDGTPRLTDFGVAQMGTRTRMTQGGSIIGTYAYLSPEVCLGDELDSRTDIWAFGVMMYEMLTGRRPFEEKQPAALLTAILNKDVPDIAEYRPDIPERLADLIHSMLEKNREQRISSVRLVGAELEEIIQHSDLLDTDTRGKLTGDNAPERFNTPTPSSARPRPARNTPTPRRSSGIYNTPAKPVVSGGEEKTLIDQPSPVTNPSSAAPQAKSARPRWLIPAVAVIVLLVLGIGGAAIAPSLSPPVATPTATTAPIAPVAEDKLMVLVAQLERLEGEEREITRFILDDLQQSLEVAVPFSQLQVRESSQIVRSAEEASALAEETGAVVIIWGNYTPDTIEINVQVGSAVNVGTLVIPRATIEQVANVRLILDDPRQQSLAPLVAGVTSTLFYGTGNVFEIARAAAIITELNPDTALITGNSLAERYHRALQIFLNDPDGAVEELDAAIRLVADNPVLYANRALVNLRLGSPDTADTDARSAMRLAPENWVVPNYILTTTALFFTFDYDMALENAMGLVENTPDDWFAHMLRAVVYYNRGDYDLAQIDIERSIVLGPQANFPYSLAASIAMHQNRVEDATSLAEQALREFPDPSQGNLIVASIFGEGLPITRLSEAYGNMALGQWDRAIEETQLAIETGPATSDMYLVLGLAYCNTEDFGLAADAYSAGIELDPEFWLLYLLRAEVRNNQGDFLGALADITTVQESPVANLYNDLIERGLRGEEGLDCESFFS